MSVRDLINKYINRPIEINGPEGPIATPRPSPTPLPKRAEFNVSLDQKNKVIATLLAEAIAEGGAGMHAVMNVINNRLGTKTVDGKRVRANVFDVVSEPAQFTGFSQYHRVYKKFRDFLRGSGETLDDNEKEMLKTATDIYNKASLGQLEDLTGGANQYYNPASSSPSWGTKMRDVRMIGSHRFGKL